MGKGNEVVDVAGIQRACTVEAIWAIEFSHSVGHHQKGSMPFRVELYAVMDT